MTVFTGDFDVKLDAKGRFLFPAALLQQAGEEGQETFVIKKDIYEPCLTVFTKGEWERQVETIRKNLNPFNRQNNMRMEMKADFDYSKERDYEDREDFFGKF